MAPQKDLGPTKTLKENCPEIHEFKEMFQFKISGSDGVPETQISLKLNVPVTQIM